MTRWPVIAAALAAGTALGTTAAQARVEAHPYLEVQQVFDADLSGGDHSTDAYTGLGAGIDVTVDTAHAKAQLDYRYDHYFSWSHHYPDGDTHNALASGIYDLGSGFSLNAAGIATRDRGTLGAASPGFFAGDFNNTQQVYAVEAGPSVARTIGPFSVNGDYRFGWSKADSGFRTIDLGPGQPRLDNDFTQTSHTFDGSIGLPARAGYLPVGLSVSGGYIRDNIHFLGAHYDGSFVQGEVTVPITPTLAAVGGAGYEWNQASVRQILTDGQGNAILTDHRRLQSDPSKPRILVYDQDGLIWDVGVLWRPNDRLSLEVRGGRRYGETAVTGNLNWQVGRQETVQVVAYNDVQSFGRQLSSEAGTLPTSFTSPNGLIPIGITGCVFGTNGGAGTCLPALSSVNSNFYRSHGVYALWSMARGNWGYGLGVSWDHRRYLGQEFDLTNAISYDHVTDDTVTVNGTVSRQLSRVSALTGTAYVAWYKSDLFDNNSYTSYGVTGAYSRLFTPHLTGEAAISVYSGAGDGIDDDVIGTAVLAIRYTL